MRVPTGHAPRRHRTGLLGGSRLIRIRLWLAMLGLAVLPMVGVIYLIGSFSEREAPASSDPRAFQTAASAADLAASEQAIEQRLMDVAADADVRRLVDGFYDLMDADPAYAVLRALHPADLSGSRDKL